MSLRHFVAAGCSFVESEDFVTEVVAFEQR